MKELEAQLGRAIYPVSSSKSDCEPGALYPGYSPVPSPIPHSAEIWQANWRPNNMANKDVYVHNKTDFLNCSGNEQVIRRSVMHKTRLFGQSHWINGVALFKDLFTVIEPLVREETSAVATAMGKCKHLARLIKSRRASPWPTPPTSDLPPKKRCDELVECYLRSIETVFRILHIPTFKKDYDTIWETSDKRDTAFLVQLKLVLAIGATVYDENFSMRTTAIRWIYEAQTWCAEPSFKPRLSIPSLQTQILLLVARESAGIGDELTWISVGQVLRTAVYMGFHRDPAYLPKRSTLAAEMRRRLWNTILEITLQSSITTGNPAYISFNDFDTEPPGNFDDDELLLEDPTPVAQDEYTQSSAAIALRKSFPVRLAITKYLNDISSHGTYEEALRLDAQLRAAYKSVRRTLQKSNSKTGCSASDFEVRIVDFIMHRFLSTLHVPFFAHSLQEASYAFSRKVVIETALKLWLTTFPASSVTAGQVNNKDAPSPAMKADDVTRLTISGSGFFRTAAFQACLLVGAELRAQLQEEASLGPIQVRPDLLAVLDEIGPWHLRTIEAGETNIKGHLFSTLLVAHIRALMDGTGNDDLPRALIKAGEGSMQVCLPMLEAMAVRCQAESSLDTDLDQMSLNSLPNLPIVEDWDSMILDAQFSNYGDAQPMSWMFSDDIMNSSLW
jgi:hypothetical protein